MQASRITRIPIIEEEDAEDEVAEIYNYVKQDMRMPHIPNAAKAMAISPAALQIQMALVSAMFKHQTLPQALTAMISYTIAERSNCEYCSASNELMCRTLGVNDDTLKKLIDDLDNVNPERIRVIIEFAFKAAKNPRDLETEDYDRLRDQGVTDAEIVEIILFAAIAEYNDIIADALKVEVDEPILEALGRQ